MATFRLADRTAAKITRVVGVERTEFGSHWVDAICKIRSTTRLLHIHNFTSAVSSKSHVSLRMLHTPYFVPNNDHHNERVKQRNAPVAPFVVVPRYQLHEVVVQSNSGLGVEDARPVQ